MNILPLVIAFVLIFGGVALSFLRDAKFMSVMEITSSSFYQTERVVNNHLAQRAYRNFKAEAKAKSEGGEKKNQTGSFRSRRTLFPPYENSKVNLAALFEYQGEIKLHPLYESMAELLRLMYQKNLFSQLEKGKKWEYTILDALLYKGRSAKEIDSLADLFPDDQKIQNLFYKMMRGTGQYDETRGYPPLGDFFCIWEKAPAVSLTYASPLLLQALFGEEAKNFIMEEEEKKWGEAGKHEPIAKAQVESYLLNQPGRASTYTAIAPFLDDSRQAPLRDSISGKDRRTGIIVRAEI